MACETKTTTINGLSISVTQWPIMTALRMKMRMAKIIGPAMGPLVAMAENDTKLEVAITEALSAVFGSPDVDPDSIVSFIKDCCTAGGVVVNGKMVDDAVFTEMFSGDGMGNLYAVLGFIIKTNFGDLVGGLGKLAGSQAEATATTQNVTQG